MLGSKKEYYVLQGNTAADDRNSSFLKTFQHNRVFLQNQHNLMFLFRFPHGFCNLYAINYITVLEKCSRFIWIIFQN